jgi:ABC-type branched-subunit amino acid transport system ATPase component
LELKNDYAGDLSGGQKKLLSLGRIFMLEPDMILLDEPTAGVNPTLRVQLMEAIKQLQKLEKKAFFIIEHSMKVISSICDKVYVLNFGQKIAKGTPEEIQKNEQVLEAYLGGV